MLEKLAMLRSESGYPYIMFQDNVNNVHANNHISKVKFSNLCSEVLQASQVSSYTDYGQEDEIGLDISCNLGSLNILNVMKNKSLEQTVKLATDSLTHVSETTNITNAPAVKKANKAMKSIGLGAMNLHGFLAQNNIAYESEEARDFANTFFMMMNFYSIERSAEIAKEKVRRTMGTKVQLTQRVNTSKSMLHKISRLNSKKWPSFLKACTSRQKKTGSS